MERVLLLDIDGTVYSPGNGNDDEDEFLPGALERLLELQKEYTIFAFSCRPPGKWIQNLVDAGVDLRGYIAKPMADEYAFVDDKLTAGSRTLTPGDWIRTPGLGVLDGVTIHS